MEHWQFLIQKQGDRSWHALESPNTEILEGRYRVLARSNLANQDVEVRVTYFSTQEVPPKRRIQKRLRRTNSEGLMAVIPFTYLKPGIWELRCSGDLISDILGKSWQYGVHLQVNSQPADEVEQELEIENDLETISFHQLDSISTSDDNVTANSPTELAIANESHFLSTGFSLDEEGSAIDEPVNPVWVKGETAEQILQNLIDLALPTSELLLEEAKVEDLPQPEPSLPLLLQLDRETYTTRWGQLLSIHGSVELQKSLESADETLKIKNLYAVELRIELRSPLRPEVLTQIRQSLGEKSLPLTIHSAIDIPADCESKLILADIKLYGAIANPGEASLLASHSFTITADVADLLAVKNAVKASLVDEQNGSLSVIPTPEITTSIDLELFNLVKATSSGKLQPTYPSVNIPLPEQIEPQLVKKSADFRVPQLPKLPENPIEEMTPVDFDLVLEPSSEIPVLEEQDTTVPLTPAPINLGQLVIKQRRLQGRTLPYLKRLSNAPSTSEAEISQVADEITPVVPEELSQVDILMTEPETHLEDVGNDLAVQDEAVEEVEAQATSDIIETLEIEETIDTSTTELAVEPLTELIAEDIAEVSIAPPSPYSSPLIRKWMERQGYSLPGFFTRSNHVPQEQITPEEETSVSLSWENPEFEELVQEGEIEAVETDLISLEEIENQISVEVENISPASSVLQPVLAPTEPIQTASTWLTQEIVVDDSDNEPELDTSKSQLPKVEEEVIANTIDALPEMLEPLPIPQLYVPDGELIAGTLVRVRVELPQVDQKVVVKLWVEDCQTRWLLDGPHLLAELLPNSSGNLEVMTQLNIPFGCLEIRIEAIALNTVTQQESHKVTVVKTVIPPDLPNVSLNDLLGM